MEKLDKLLADLRQLDTKIDALLANDNLTAEQLAEHDALVAQRKSLVTSIDNEKGRQSREQERTKLESEAKAAKERAEEAKALADEKARRTGQTGTGRLTDPEVTTPAVIRPAQRQQIIPASVRRFGTLKNFTGTRGDRSAEERAYRFGMWGLRTLSLQVPHRYRFQNAIEWVEKQMSAILEKDASGAQYTVPEEFGDDMIVLRELYGVARRILKNVQMTTDTRTDPRRRGGLTAYVVGEGGAGTESQKLWDRVRLTAKEVMVLSRVSNQIDADSVINWGDDLAGEIAYAFSLFEDQAAFTSTGTSTYGGIVGLVQKFAAIAGTPAGVQVAGAATGWAGLTLADFNLTAGLLPQYADTPNTCWLCHRSFYYGVMQKLELAAGGVTALEISQGDRKPRPLFLGYPVEFSQVMPTNQTATSTIACYLGDFKLGGSLGDRQKDEIMFSEHASVGGENVFERNEIAIRGIERIDIVMHDVGDATNAGPIVALQTHS